MSCLPNMGELAPGAGSEQGLGKSVSVGDEIWAAHLFSEVKQHSPFNLINTKADTLISITLYLAQLS